MPIKIDTKKFIERCRVVHKDFYDYSKTKYTAQKKPVNVMCPIHGQFTLTAQVHQRGGGCQACGNIKKGSTTKNKSLQLKKLSVEKVEDYYIIPLSKGYATKISEEDLERVIAHNWSIKDSYPNSNLYAKSRFVVDGKVKMYKLHRFILGVTDPTIHVDHINGDGLDNRRCNLRLCTASQNASNKKLSKGTSKYKGVYKVKDFKYISYITINYKRINIGTFITEEDAARAYDTKAKELHKEFANLNFN